MMDPAFAEPLCQEAAPRGACSSRKKLLAPLSLLISLSFAAVSTTTVRSIHDHSEQHMVGPNSPIMLTDVLEYEHKYSGLDVGQNQTKRSVPPTLRPPKGFWAGWKDVTKQTIDDYNMTQMPQFVIGDPFQEGYNPFTGGSDNPFFAGLLRTGKIKMNRVWYDGFTGKRLESYESASERIIREANGEVETKEEEETLEMDGTVRSFIVDKGFGFIEPEVGGGELFFHVSSLKDGKEVVAKDTVRFTVRWNERTQKYEALNVQKIEKSDAPQAVATGEDTRERKTGTLVSWFDSKGYGFIDADEGGDNLFCHTSKLLNGDGSVKQGDKVSYVLLWNERQGKNQADLVQKEDGDGIAPAMANATIADSEAAADSGAVAAADSGSESGEEA